MLNKIPALKKLNDTYSKCSLCSVLSSNRNSVVFGVGDPNTCKILIIGEAPGNTEDLSGVPFVGRSGKLLDSFLEEINLSRPKDVYITNTVLCRPPKNRNPTKEELKKCNNRLNEQIKILNPRVVVTLGNFATKAILETKEGITKIRGKVFDHKFGDFNFKVIPMKHPATLLYSGMSKVKMDEFREDFQIILNVISKK